MDPVQVGASSSPSSPLAVTFSSLGDLGLLHFEDTKAPSKGLMLLSKLVEDSDITINSRHVLASCCRLLEINMSSGATWCGRKRLSITHSMHLALM